MAALTEAQLEHFYREGYVVVEDLFHPEEDLDPVIAEYHEALDILAEDLCARGEISSTFAGLPFGQRLIEIVKESGRVHAQYFDFTLHGAAVTEETKLWVGPEVFKVLRSERLLDAVESLIGPEIYSNPVQHVRLKPPESITPRDAEGRLLLTKTPPHQDNGVVLPEADQTEMLTVWFPLWDATVENGCMMVWPRSHRQGLLEHCPRYDGVQVPGQLLPPGAVSLPMRRGDALFMHRLTLHASHANLSDNIRWSFDLRYNPIGQPTGRGYFPGFVARSRAHPETELRDAAAWAQLWYDCRRHLAAHGAGPFNRWDAESPVCA
jgi:phytanoyl-CoA hydroxylase